MGIFTRLRQQKAFEKELEIQQNAARHLEEKGINPNEREVMRYREHARQEAIKEELKAWKKLEREDYNKSRFLSNENYFKGGKNLMQVENQFAGKKPFLQNVPTIFGKGRMKPL